MVSVANHIVKADSLCFVVGLCLTFAGCGGGSSPEPAQLGRFRPTPAVNIILDSLGVAEEPVVAWANGEAPEPRDVLAVKSDYTLRAGDVVRISIFELLQEGATATNDYVVSETGRISIPEVGIVQAGGLTEVQLEQGIKQALAPAVLKNPSVSVTLVESRQRMFSVLGVGVSQPGRYPIPRSDFRLTDALAAAGGPAQLNVSYVYVSRSEESAQQGAGTAPGHEMELIEPQTSGRGQKPAGGATLPPAPPAIGPGGVPQPSEPAEKFETQQEMLDLIAPSAKQGTKAEDREQKTESSAVRPPSSILRQPSSDHADISASDMPGGFRLVVPAGPSSPSGPGGQEIVQTLTEVGGGGAAATGQPSADPNSAGRVEWVFRDGQWVPVPVPDGTQPAAARPGSAGAVPGKTEDRGQKAEPSSVISGPAQKPTEEQPEWVFKEGQWVQVRKGQPESVKPPLTPVPARPTLPAEGEQAVQTRLIKIPTDRLLAGDPRYNVIIKPGDVIYVPADIIGEFYITGNVNHSGSVHLTGRPMNLKQAIAAAGGLGPGARSKYCEVVRRIGAEQEEIAMFDLDKIARGEQPDVFIKPNDLINVGADYGLGQRNRQ